MLAFWQGGFELWPGAIAAGLVLLLTLPDNRTLARALAALAVCTFGLSAMQALIRQPARPLPPVAALHRLDGGAVSLAAYRGKPVIINLWATWCPPCRRELRSEEHTSELQSPMRNSYAVFCLKNTNA